MEEATRRELRFGRYEVVVFFDDRLRFEMEEGNETLAFQITPHELDSGKHLLAVNVVNFFGNHVGAVLKELTIGGPNQNAQ